MLAEVLCDRLQLDLPCVRSSSLVRACPLVVTLYNGTLQEAKNEEETAHSCCASVPCKKIHYNFPPDSPAAVLVIWSILPVPRLEKTAMIPKPA